jgi:uncharacterized protein YbjT (DUF2867 family)
MFAVMGATGKVGGAVARALLAADQSVRVVVRDTRKASTWSSRNCEVAAAEINNASGLAQALAGTQGAFVMLPPLFDPTPGFPEARDMIAALRTALLRAQPARAVVLSTIGAQATKLSLLSQLGLLENTLADLPMPVTFLRAAWFMENAAWDLRPARETGVIQSYLQPLDKPFPMVAAEDVGRAAADLLREGWSGHRIVELEGPRRVSPHDLAEAFEKALSRPVRAEIVPRDRWNVLFREQGMKNPLPRVQMLDGFNEGWIEFERRSEARKGAIAIEGAIAALALKEGQNTAAE